jgi:microcystin degradation protein MlrC
MARLAVARLWFCSNSFTPRRTRAEDVQSHEWLTGPAALSGTVAGDGELDGVRAFLATRPGWDATMLRCASAPAGGPLSAELFGAWMAEVEDALRRGRFDAIYLSLHGACQAEGDPAADVTILRRVRSIVGHTPIVASFDMRANMSEEIAILLDGASSNQIWPSGGQAQAAERALALLEGILNGRCRPVGALARVPTIMSDLLLPEAIGEITTNLLRDLRRPVLEASVFGGFGWGDSPYAGPSALVWADRDSGAARELAAHLAMTLSRWRSRAAPVLVPPDEALRSLAAIDAAAGHTEPAVLFDPSDDPASGGLVDTPDLLRAVLAAAANGSYGERVLFAALHDPDATAEAIAGGVGATMPFTLGGRSTPLYGMGLTVSAVVARAQSISPFGGFAVLRSGTVDILVTSVRPAVITPQMLLDAGLDPQAYRLLAIKGGATAMAAFAGRVGTTILCDCAGPASPDLVRLPYHYVPVQRRSPIPVRSHDVPAPATVALAESATVSPDHAAQVHEERRGAALGNQRH